MTMQTGKGKRVEQWCEDMTAVPVDPDTAAAVSAFRGDMQSIGSSLIVGAPQGRHLSLALTALEEAAMWGIKALTHGGRDTE